MSKDFLERNTVPPGMPPSLTSQSTTSGASQKSAPKRGKRPDGTTTTIPSIGQSTDILLGDSILANAMELSDSVTSPAIEEAAILYANGQAYPAVAVLSEAIKVDHASTGNAHAWLMLFELYQSLGKRSEFENLAIDYAVRFETAAPNWSEPSQDSGLPVEAHKNADAVPLTTVAFRGTLDAGIVPQLDQLKRMAQKHTSLRLEFNQITGVDINGADLILRVLAAFQKSNHVVTIEGAEHLANLLLAAIDVGRRDASNAVWMLLLEMYRLLGRQTAFEETSIDYCVTFEVSPPAWEPASPRFKLDDRVAPAMAPVPAPATPDAGGASGVSGDVVPLTGELIGKSDADLTRLSNFAGQHRKVVIDCSQLRRVDFTAAGALLNWSVSMQVAGKTIEFREVSHLIAGLLVVMGLHEVAQIERRKL